MLKRISLIAIAATVAVLAIVATAVATPAKSSATAKVTCGKVRSIGIATPITGPAASLGSQQLAWAQFYVSQWNKQKIHKNSLQLPPKESCDIQCNGKEPHRAHPLHAAQIISFPAQLIPEAPLL